jgi:predicted DNA binding CopG/RHH family protein
MSEQEQEKRITVSVSDSLHRAVKSKGAARGMTMSDVVRTFLEAWVKDEIELPEPKEQKQ